MPRARINVGKVVTSSRFASPYTVIRSEGKWYDGQMQWTELERISIRAAVIVATPQQLEQIPEGERLSGAMSFYARQPLYTTQDSMDIAGIISDAILWNDKIYKILEVSDWSHHGYWMALAVLQRRV